MPWTWILITAAGMLSWAWISRLILDNPRGDVDVGIFYRVARLYVRIVHGLEVVGAQNIPRGRHAGPLIVVCNHTAGIDPILVQAVCEFEVRWMMASDMRLPGYEPFWQWARVISVNRMGRDAAGAREAIRHVQSGGVLGVFPEGGIERPPRTVLPFYAGVGLIIAKTRAPVLPVIIEGTPQGEHAWDSLWTLSRSRLTFHPIRHFDHEGASASQIADELRQWYMDTTGWPECPLPALHTTLADQD
jgi:1-acyl-sn-glycerol-3-phosphate acyltransferase